MTGAALGRKKRGSSRSKTDLRRGEIKGQNRLLREAGLGRVGQAYLAENNSPSVNSRRICWFNVVISAIETKGNFLLLHDEPL